MSPGFFGPPRPNDKYKEPLPKSIKEVPSYIKRLLSGFFYRFGYIVKLIWETKKWIIFVITGIALFDGLSPVISALISSEIINVLHENYGLAAYLSKADTISFIINTILWLFAANVIYAVLNAAVSSVSMIVSFIYGELVTNHIKVEIMKKAKTVDIKSFDDPEFYERFENASREASMRPMQVLNAGFNLFSSIISAISFVVVLWALSPLAPLIIILLSIPASVVNFVYRKKTFNYMIQRSKDRRQMNYYSDLMTNKDMVKEVRILGLADVFIGKYKEIFKNYFKGLRDIYVKEGLWNSLLRFAVAVSNMALVAYVSYFVYRGEMQIGSYSLYVGALSSVSSSVSAMVTQTAIIYEGTLFIDNLIKFLEEKITVVPSIANPLVPKKHTEHTVKFDRVSFRYPGNERNIIDNVSFELKSGDKAVLVGLNGAGKTTLIKLLTRLYDPTEGTIYLDGHDIKEYEPTELYKLFGIVFQDYGKYAVSVRENIMYGDICKKFDEEEIKNAANYSNADEFISRLPKGYDTPLMRYFEPDGKELSIGQWQKLAVARAYYSDSDILILDEPTASLDAMAEQEIFDRFDDLRKGKLSIFVSHRLSSAVSASKIIVLEQGRITEQGTHSELMAKEDGTYKKLFCVQASRYKDNAPDEQKDLPLNEDNG